MKGVPMGSFEKTYEVDGEKFELYAATDDSGYQLIDATGVTIAEALESIPDEESVFDLVREARAARAA